jgi:hypothetical protein
MRMTLTAVLVVLSGVASMARRQPAVQPPASSCVVSEDAEFATTRANAVQVGGGAMYAAARERRYLDALRGPVGEVLQYKRTGSLAPEADGRTILDAYEVTYAGLAKPAVFYLDA